MSFLVTACGHSGTRLFAMQLGQAPGWKVEHEPNAGISFRFVSERFQGKSNYGEVNSFLLTSARHIPADKKAVLLRNPYDILASVVRGGSYGSMQGAISYVRESISTLDGLAVDGFMVMKFAGITRSRKYVVKCAQALGIDTLTADMVRVKTKLNHHQGAAVDLTGLDAMTQRQFDTFIYVYGL